jgi:catechol 2,3-dioxygenase-like lactoylglutathione lyase family enzyme
VLDHVSLPVSDLDRSKRFYEEALSPLGYEPIMDHHISGVGFGQLGNPDFWIRQGVPGNAVHVAFAAVDAFHKGAITVDGRNNGRPGLRPEYHPTYYGAYVLDPDGNNIEAVCHKPGKAALVVGPLIHPSAWKANSRKFARTMNVRGDAQEKGRSVKAPALGVPLEGALVKSWPLSCGRSAR